MRFWTIRLGGGAAAAPIAAGSLIVGTGMSIAGHMKTARAQESAAAAAVTRSNVEAIIAEQEADAERWIAETNADEFLRSQSRTLAARRAAMGGSGVELSSGSALDTTLDFVAETELEAVRIRAGGELRGSRLEQEAMFTRMAGLEEASERRAMASASRGRAGASLLKGIGTGATLFGPGGQFAVGE